MITNLPAATWSISPVDVTVLSCVTPDVMVPMGTHSASELTGLNTFTSAASFNVSLNSCPAGMNTVQYEIQPSTAVIDRSQSVVALDSSSTATGVGVQLLDGTGAVFPLSTRVTFSGYNQSTGGSYTIPFQARCYQTADTVGPGRANTSMALVMTYQ